MENKRKLSQNYHQIHLLTYNTHQAPSEKGSTLKRKNLLPWGANSFLLEQTLFQKGGKTILTRVVSTESVYSLTSPMVVMAIFCGMQWVCNFTVVMPPRIFYYASFQNVTVFNQPNLTNMAQINTTDNTVSSFLSGKHFDCRSSN